MRITVVVDDVAGRNDLRSEHGLAMHIECSRWSVLFDTGATVDVLRDNCQALGIDVSGLDGVVISHGHYDHTGGLGMFAQSDEPVSVYAHPEAFAWKGHSRSPRHIGSPWLLEQVSSWPVQLTFVESPTEVLAGLTLSGPIAGPAGRAMEGFTIRTSDGYAADTFCDEMFAVVEGDSGPIIVSGCCHRGLPNTIEQARQITGTERFAGLVGGLHIRSACEAELAEAAGLLDDSIAGPVLVNHCTSAPAIEYLREKLAIDRVGYLAGGQTVDL